MKKAYNKQLVLDKALAHVPFDGWTEETFQRAAKESLLDAGTILQEFPEGLTSLVQFFSEDTDRKMLEELQAYNLEGMRVRERIKTAVRVRILLFKDNPSIVARTLSFYALPPHMGQATNALFQTVDQMWQAAGDNATDFNYYSKRFLLAGVYSSTLLYWLDDQSEDFNNTWEFLDRRIENVMQFGKAQQNIKNSFTKWEELPFIRLWCKK